MNLRLGILVLCLSSRVVFASDDDRGIEWKEPRHHHHPPPQANLWKNENSNSNDKQARNRPIPIKVTKYALHVSAHPETGLLGGTSSIVFQSKADNLETVVIDAYDMEFGKVKVENHDAPFVYDGQTLEITLPKAFSFDEKSSITIEYTARHSQSYFLAKPDAVNPHRALGAYTHTQPDDSRKWFPCIDRPFAKAPFDIYLRVPKGYGALSNGSLVSTKKINDSTTELHYHVSQPIAPYLVSLAIGKYEIYDIGQYKTKLLRLWTQATIANAALRDTARTQTMMEHISHFTGVEYPFPIYTQSIAQGWEVSMEHQTASTLGSWVITGDGWDEDTIIHELAHQWFGNWVTPESWSDLWLSEGFATYIPYIFFEENGSKTRALSELDEWREGYFNEARKKVHALSPSIPDIDSMFDAHAYEKGAMVVKFMRYMANHSPNKVAKDRFHTAIKNYLNDHAQKTVRHVDLQKALEDATGQSWQTFFDQWVRSPGHPELQVNFENKEKEFLLKITQAQSVNKDKVWPTFQFPIDVDLFAKDGRHVRKTLEIYDDVQEFHLHPGFEVVGLDFDPNWEIPVDIDLEDSLSGFMNVLKHSPSERGRLTAMRRIFAHPNFAPSEEFIQLLIDDPSLYIKADALAKLTKKTTNKLWVERLLYSVNAREKEWDQNLRTASAATRAWLVRTGARTLTPQDEARLQNDFRHAPLTVGERKAILEELTALSLTRTQEFAAARLKEAFWSMRDRSHLVDVLVKMPTDTSLPFILDALKDTGIWWARKIMTNLTAAEYDRKEMVPILLQRAKTARVLSTRKHAVELLGEQNSSRDQVCPELIRIAKIREPNFDRLDDIRQAAIQAQAELQCPGASSTRAKNMLDTKEL